MLEVDHHVNVLGVHIGHDSSAALVQDGVIIADAQEERFRRVKHFAGAPVNAVAYCLRQGGLTVEQIDVIAVPSKRAVRQLGVMFDLDERREKGLRRRLLERLPDPEHRWTERPPLAWPRFPLNDRDVEFVHVEHHLSHAASAHLTTGWEEPHLVVTCDGVGDGVSTAVWRAEGGMLTPLVRIGVEGSLGWFYGIVTEALGWVHGDGEGKTMGLAAYGDGGAARRALERFCPRYERGELARAVEWRGPYWWDDGGALLWHFEDAKEIGALIAEHGAENVAAAAQDILEEQVANLVHPWLEREGLRALACAGGLFLNVKVNQRLWASGRLDRHHVFPNAGDGGLALGAALHVHHSAGSTDVPKAIDVVYWGPDVEDDAIEAVLRLRNLPYRQVDDLAGFVAARLSADEIVAWVQGRMESGPRALGNRSILMSPQRAQSKDRLNERVKYREGFRPFCPSMPLEAAPDYLVGARDEPFMITSFDANPERAMEIPAVVHVDGTVRPQMVTPDRNARYWELLTTFGQLTRTPVLLNTSLNIRGEPIVATPSDAIRCFFDTGIDHLVLGSYVLSKG